jgi:hypothetical protein
MADFGTFTIKQIIMHHVRRAAVGDKSAAPIQFSEAPVTLAQQDRVYIQTRMRKALASVRPLDRPSRSTSRRAALPYPTRWQQRSSRTHPRAVRSPSSD